MKNRSGHIIGIRLLLLRDYICANATKTKAVSREEIQTYLANKDFPMERKAIFNDIATLSTEFGLNVYYSRKHKGYILENPPYEPHELRLMVDSIQSSKFITKKKAAELTEKIKRLAGKDLQASLNRQAYVADRVRSMNDSVVNEADRIHQAIATDRKIGFKYTHYSPDKNKVKTYSKSGEQLIVSPYALYWNNGNYYLYAYDGKKFRFYRVDRMDGISLPKAEKREGKELFREKDLTASKVKVFDMYSGPEHLVKIRFRNELADAVIDQFGRDVMMIPLDDEHFTITVPVQISPPFFAWIATFGRRVKILGPEPVVEKMRDFIQRAADMYKDD